MYRPSAGDGYGISSAPENIRHHTTSALAHESTARPTSAHAARSSRTSAARTRIMSAPPTPMNE